MLNKKDINNINKALELAITNAMFPETKKKYKDTYIAFNEEYNKCIHLTHCSICGKRIALEVINKENYKHNHYSCNDCIPKNCGSRNGIDESLETDLFDEINTR